MTLLSFSLSRIPHYRTQAEKHFTISFTRKSTSVIREYHSAGDGSIQLFGECRRGAVFAADTNLRGACGSHQGEATSTLRGCTFV